MFWIDCGLAKLPNCAVTVLLTCVNSYYLQPLPLFILVGFIVAWLVLEIGSVSICSMFNCPSLDFFIRDIVIFGLVLSLKFLVNWTSSVPYLSLMILVKLWS